MLENSVSGTQQHDSFITHQQYAPTQTNRMADVGKKIPIKLITIRYIKRSYFHDSYIRDDESNAEVFHLLSILSKGLILKEKV